MFTPTVMSRFLMTYVLCLHFSMSQTGFAHLFLPQTDHVGQELEDSLGQVEVVTDYIEIAQSSAVLSLSFFRSLRLIKGEALYNDRCDTSINLS